MYARKRLVRNSLAQIGVPKHLVDIVLQYVNRSDEEVIATWLRRLPRVWLRGDDLSDGIIDLTFFRRRDCENPVLVREIFGDERMQYHCVRRIARRTFIVYR